jgi:hypothetical protein
VFWAAIEKFVADRGRQPTGPEAVRIRQQATLETRQPKHVSTLAEYTADWTRRADLIFGSDARAGACRVTAAPVGAAATLTAPDAQRSRLATSGAIDEQAAEILAAAALDQVEAKRATWSRWNIVAATCRTIAAAALQFDTEQDLLAVRRRVTNAAIERSVLLNPATAPGVSSEVDATTGRSIYDAPEVHIPAQLAALVIAENRVRVATQPSAGRHVKPTGSPTAPNGVDVANLRQSLIIAAALPTLASFHKNAGDSIPTRPNRHAAVHAISNEQYTLGNAIESVLLAVSVLRQEQDNLDKANLIG